MAFLPAKYVNTNLNEELEALGIKTNKVSFRNLSFGGLNESTVVPTMVDDIESEVMTEGLIERITTLLESRLLSEADLNDLLNELKTKTIPSDNAIEEACELLVKAIYSQLDESTIEEHDESFENELSQSMIDRISSLLDEGSLTSAEVREIIEGLKEFDEPSDVETCAHAEELVERLFEAFRQITVDGKKKKVKVASGQARTKQRAQARKYKKSGAYKARLRDQKKLRKKSSYKREMGRKLKAAKRLGTRESIALDLAKALQLDNSNVIGEERDIIERISSIFSLLKEEFSDATGVSEVINEAYHGMCEGLEESEGDFLNSIKPSLKIISRLMEELEGND